MPSFSDEDLKRLKEELWSGPPNGKLLDLLARLEASERYHFALEQAIRYTHDWHEVELAKTSWCISAGKDGKDD